MIQTQYQIGCEINPRRSLMHPVVEIARELFQLLPDAPREAAMPICWRLGLHVHAIHVSMHQVFGDAYVNTNDPLNRSHVEGHQLAACVCRILLQPALERDKEQLAHETAEFDRREAERYRKMAAEAERIQAAEGNINQRS